MVVMMSMDHRVVSFQFPIDQRGWKIFTIGPGRVMFYSSSGRSLTSRVQADKYLAPNGSSTNQDDVLKNSTNAQLRTKAVGMNAEVLKSCKSWKNTSNSKKNSRPNNKKKKAENVKTLKVDNATGEGETIVDIVDQRDSDQFRKYHLPKHNFITNPSNIHITKAEKPGCTFDDASYDEITLSDDEAIRFKETDYLLMNSNIINRKQSYHQDEPRPKKLRGEKNMKALSEMQQPSSVSSTQEEVLLAAFREWPVAMSSVVKVLEQETGLSGPVLEGWYLQTREECLRLLWGQDD